MRSLAREREREGRRKGNVHKRLTSSCCGKINVISNYPTVHSSIQVQKTRGKKIAKTQEELTQIKLPFLHPALFSFLTVNKARLRLMGEALKPRGELPLVTEEPWIILNG